MPLLVPVLALACQLAVMRQDPTYDLQWRPRANALMNYKLQLEIDTTPDKFAFTANLKSRVVKVKPNGDYDIETSIKEAKVRHGSHEEAFADDSKPTIDTYNSRGEKIATTEDVDPTEEVNPGLNTLDSITDQLMPRGPVKIGETWTAVLQPNKKLKRDAGKVTYKLIGIEKQGTIQALKVEFKYTETEKDIPLTASGFIALSLQDFSLVRFEGSLKGAKFSSDPDFPAGDATLSVVRN